MNSFVRPSLGTASGIAGPRWSYLHVSMASDLLPLADLVLVALSAWIGALLCQHWFGPTSIAAGHASHAAQVSIIAVVLSPFMLHDRRIGTIASRGRIWPLVGWFALRFLVYAGVVLALAASCRVLTGTPATWLGIWFALALWSTLLARVLLGAVVRRLQRMGHLIEVVAVVGAGPVADRLVGSLLRTRPANVELLGIFDDPGGGGVECRMQSSGTIEQLIELGQSRRIDWIVLTLPATAQAPLRSMVQRLKSLSAPIALCPQNIGMSSSTLGAGMAGGAWPVDLPQDRRTRGPHRAWAAGADPLPRWLVSVAVLPLQAGSALLDLLIQRRSAERRPLPRRSRLEFDDYDLAGFAAVAAGFGQDRFGYVVTPNADHIIRLHEDSGFRALYASASYVLLDSRFLARVLRLAKGIRLPVCTGSDLTAKLLGERTAPQDRLVLIGGSALQAQALRARYGLHGLVHYCPPMGFIRDATAVEACLRFVETHSPFRYCLLAVGSPQQETVAQQLQLRGAARGLVLCVGASIDFLTGNQRRAPKWMQDAGIEWLFRLCRSPRRLGHRYLVRGPRIFGLLRTAQITLRPPPNGRI